MCSYRLKWRKKKLKRKPTINQSINFSSTSHSYPNSGAVSQKEPSTLLSHFHLFSFLDHPEITHWIKPHRPHRQSEQVVGRSLDCFHSSLVLTVDCTIRKATTVIKAATAKVVSDIRGSTSGSLTWNIQGSAVLTSRAFVFRPIQELFFLRGDG